MTESGMMSEPPRDQNDATAFARMMRLGQVAHAQGNNRIAHDYWRRAAILQPDNEQVWVALLDILENEDDKRVCLQNILTINPANKQAQRLLQKMNGATLTSTNVVPDIIARENMPQPESGSSPLILAIEAILIGVLIGIGIIASRFLSL